MSDYAIVVVPLSEEDGGGWKGLAVDLPGCVSDGETREEAARNVSQAIGEWLEECARLGRAPPPPGSAARLAREERRALLEMISVLADKCAALYAEDRDISQESKERINAVNAVSRLHHTIDELLQKTRALSGCGGVEGVPFEVPETLGASSRIGSAGR